MKKMKIFGLKAGTVAAVVAVIALATGLAACDNGGGGDKPGGTPGGNSGGGTETGSGSSLVLSNGTAKPANIGNYEGKSNVLKIEGKNAGHAIVVYPLTKYKGKQITIDLSVNVRREGAAGNLGWQVNNPDYPYVANLPNAPAGAWHSITGNMLVTPTDGDPHLFLTTWNNNADTTTFYIADFTVTITEGSAIKPDLTLPALKTTYKDYFPIGNIIDPVYMDSPYFDLLKHHYSTVTPGNALKPDALAPAAKSGKYNFDTADKMVKKMRDNGIAVHGHVLVWHGQTHSWMFNEADLKAHINTVLGHYKGKGQIAAWDVVNEAMADGLTAAQAAGDWKDCLRKDSGWYREMGAGFIEKAFRIAREADPGVTLFYNDYNLDNQPKAEAVKKMIADINATYRAEGNTRDLIDGVGLQSHYGSDARIEDVRACLDKFISIGVKIDVSELDVQDRPWFPGIEGEGRDTTMTDAALQKQADFYAALFKLYMEKKDHIGRVTMWGMDDRNSWRSVANPCLFDGKLNAKRAFHAVSNPNGSY